MSPSAEEYAYLFKLGSKTIARSKNGAIQTHGCVFADMQSSAGSTTDDQACGCKSSLNVIECSTLPFFSLHVAALIVEDEGIMQHQSCAQTRELFVIVFRFDLV